MMSSWIGGSANLRVVFLLQFWWNSLQLNSVHWEPQFKILLQHRAITLWEPWEKKMLYRTSSRLITRLIYLGILWHGGGGVVVGPSTTAFLAVNSTSTKYHRPGSTDIITPSAVWLYKPICNQQQPMQRQEWSAHSRSQAKYTVQQELEIASPSLPSLGVKEEFNATSQPTNQPFAKRGSALPSVWRIGDFCVYTLSGIFRFWTSILWRRQERILLHSVWLWLWWW